MALRSKKVKHLMACLVAQWLESGVAGLTPDPGRSPMPQATKPLHHSCGACALEPGSRNHRNHMLQAERPAGPRVRAPRQEKPPQ